MTWDRSAIVAALPVAAVAVIAGVVSFGHIEGLALAQHQPIADARLLPLAVDGLIVSGSVILLCGSALGWLGVVPGIVATVFANVESGIGHGPSLPPWQRGPPPRSRWPASPWNGGSRAASGQQPSAATRAVMWWPRRWTRR